MDQTVTRKTNGVTEIGIAGVDSTSPVKVKGMPVWKLLLVRVSRMYLQVFLGLLSLDGLGAVEMSGPIRNWGMIEAAMVTSLIPTLVAFAQNLLEYLTKLDVTNPELRA